MDLPAMAIVLVFGGLWGWYLATVYRERSEKPDQRCELHNTVSDLCTRVHRLNKFVPNNRCLVHFDHTPTGAHFEMTIVESAPLPEGE